jgi:hypothetical protein
MFIGNIKLQQKLETKNATQYLTEGEFGSDDEPAEEA